MASNCLSSLCASALDGLNVEVVVVVVVDVGEAVVDVEVEVGVGEIVVVVVEVVVVPSVECTGRAPRNEGSDSACATRDEA